MSARLRPRLSRTLALARWREYDGFLECALDSGYRIVALEDWVLDGADEELVLVLRHDVDQHPRSALEMAAIERERDIRSTWYFRWRTAERGVVRAMRDGGAAVGLHYETLSRLALERRVRSPAGIASLVDEARAVLGDEVRAFERIHGPIRSICAHGDSRIPGAQNGRLLQGVDPSSLGVEFDANEAMRGRGLAHWLTDRSLAEGRWAGGVDPRDLFRDGLSPVLGVVHPNNWVSGPSLWTDRILGTVLTTDHSAGRRFLRRPLRTGTDGPPV